MGAQKGAKMVSTYQKEDVQLGWEEEVGSCSYITMFLILGGRGALSSSGENIQLVANSDCDNRAHKITA